MSYEQIKATFRTIYSLSEVQLAFEENTVFWVHLTHWAKFLELFWYKWWFWVYCKYLARKSRETWGATGLKVAVSIQCNFKHRLHLIDWVSLLTYFNRCLYWTFFSIFSKILGKIIKNWRNSTCFCKLCHRHLTHWVIRF